MIEYYKEEKTRDWFMIDNKTSEGGQPALCRPEQKASSQSSALRAMSGAGENAKRSLSGTVVSCRRARHKWSSPATGGMDFFSALNAKDRASH